uniref:Uncharacterized protein n=1 Tax=viral metagenome TaxID=1070528 RepID=A0A6M3LC44_9ZZZZ
MTSDERKILGVNNEKEARNLFDVVLAQAITLARIAATSEAQERARKDAKKEHDRRLTGLEHTVHAIDNKFDDLAISVAAMPEARKEDISRAVRQCKEEHDKRTMTKWQRVAVSMALFVGGSGFTFAIIDLMMR